MLKYVGVHLATEVHPVSPVHRDTTRTFITTSPHLWVPAPYVHAITERQAVKWEMIEELFVIVFQIMVDNIVKTRVRILRKYFSNI